ncbi:MAG: META domain-containing protein [Mycobacteriaceae bacterium]|nr:META domain-containing protein [Mycobacteriaceae bacterium]
MRATVKVGFVIAAIAAAAGCSSDAGDDPAPPAPQATPMGRTFLSTAVQGQAIPGGGPLELRFFDGRVSASAGCNTSNGEARFKADVLEVGQLGTTLLGCPGARAQADEWQNSLLKASPHWKLEGNTLTLATADRTVTLLDKKEAKPDKPIVGTTWAVTSLLQPDAAVTSAALNRVQPTILIDKDGKVTGSGGCNRLTGSAEVAKDGAEITFRLGSTKMMCEKDVMEIENHLTRALGGTVTAAVDADTLTLENPATDTGLVLRARPAS